MTRAELEEDISIGDTVKITTKSGEFTGRVEEFGESAVKLTNPQTGKPKRIAYDFIMEYDTDIAPAADVISIGVDSESKLVAIPGTNYRIGQTPVTQRLYKKVMGENPSYFQHSNDELDDEQKDALEGNTANNPVENVSWYDAVCFCNKLSIKEGLTPAYSVDGETDPESWGYTPHQDESIDSDVDCDFSANGYRLPTNDEWETAANGGECYTYSGSDDLDEVGWYYDNSNKVTHPVAQKMANGYGLYDMSGNVCEWVWASDPGSPDERFASGGFFCYIADICEVSYRGCGGPADDRGYDTGFRLLRP
ncbi:MAG: SUMF1/EgtB/PvdO family nonheme iron enzyme, partial [Treponema sp.]|nr:SUMF1/EgtB/PvdO family nonheme iron enzyme [Treponema sp.]